METNSESGAEPLPEKGATSIQDAKAIQLPKNGTKKIMPFGKYGLHITLAKGDGFKEGQKVLITVLEEPQEAPKEPENNQAKEHITPITDIP